MTTNHVILDPLYNLLNPEKLALVQSNYWAEILTRQGFNREYKVEEALPKLALFEEYQEQQQELVES
jgi:hypothetical protein